MSNVFEADIYRNMLSKSNKRKNFIEKAEYAKSLFEKINDRKHVAVDVRDSEKCKYLIVSENGNKKRISPLYSYGNKNSLIVMNGIIAFGKNNLFGKPIYIEDFQKEASKEDANWSKADVTRMLKKERGVGQIFKVDGFNVLLKHPLKEVITR
ncbi:MAG: hypothetical protein JW700_02770 [Candidatus Aenigmarchaeota archaeon]|nr:hypothetical protein [Candidatus Aenigmarchaeota archaeon]